MSVTVEEAARQLNFVAVPADPTELTLYVAAANEWIATRVADTSPAPVRLATLMLVDHLWSTQRGPIGVSPLDDELSSPSLAGFAIPNRVMELIRPFMVAGGGLPPGPVGVFPEAECWPDPSVRW